MHKRETERGRGRERRYVIVLLIASQSGLYMVYETMAITYYIVYGSIQIHMQLQRYQTINVEEEEKKITQLRMCIQMQLQFFDYISNLQTSPFHLVNCPCFFFICHHRRCRCRSRSFAFFRVKSSSFYFYVFYFGNNSAHLLRICSADMNIKCIHIRPLNDHCSH